MEGKSQILIKTLIFYRLFLAQHELQISNDNNQLSFSGKRFGPLPQPDQFLHTKQNIGITYNLTHEMITESTR